MTTAIRNDTRSAAPVALARALGPGLWRLDPVRSEVRFGVRAMGGLIGIRGRFNVLDGAIRLDEAGTADGRLRADARSLQTGIGMRDRHLGSADFFDAARHPYLEFWVRGLTNDPAGRIRIAGDLVIRGVAAPLQAEAVVQDAGEGTVMLAAEATVEHAAVGAALKRGRIIKGPAHLTARLYFARDALAVSGR